MRTVARSKADVAALPVSERTVSTREFLIVGALAVGAALALKAFWLLDLSLADDAGVFFRNGALVALAPVAIYFAWKRHLTARVRWILTGVFAAAALLANAYPYQPSGQTEILTGLHLAILLWLAVGVAHAGGAWRSHDKRMDFFRFSGEWLAYMGVFALAGALLAGLTVGSFSFLEIDATVFVDNWLLPCGAVGAVVVAAFLVETQRTGVATLARPVAQVLVSLSTLLLLAVLATTVLTRNHVSINRDALILMSLLLLFVLTLLIYSVAARGPSKRVHFIDRVQFTLIVCAWSMAGVVIAVALARIAQWGFTPNRIVVLGMAVIVFANFFWTSWIGHVMLHLNTPFATLDTWQTRMVWVYTAWVLIVVVVVPPAFSFA